MYDVFIPGRYVNELVLTSLLLPIIDLMMSTPPSSAISKVSELELLTIMARHDDHKQGKKNKNTDWSSQT